MRLFQERNLTAFFGFAGAGPRPAAYMNAVAPASPDASRR